MRGGARESEREKDEGVRSLMATDCTPRLMTQPAGLAVLAHCDSELQWILDHRPVRCPSVDQSLISMQPSRNDPPQPRLEQGCGRGSLQDSGIIAFWL